MEGKTDETSSDLPYSESEDYELDNETFPSSDIEEVINLGLHLPVLPDAPPEGPLKDKFKIKTTKIVPDHQKQEKESPIVNAKGEPSSIKELELLADRNAEKEICSSCRYFCTTGPETFQVHAQEPWPKDVKLFQPYEVEQILLPDNANCLAVQAFLKMCNLEFKVESRANAEAMSPSGKVPFIKAGAFVVSELEGIVQFVNGKGITLTADLETEQKNDMRAYMSLVHNVLENAELYICWCDKETYNEVTKPRYGSIYPWPLNYIQTWSKKSTIIKRLKLLGWYQKSLKDVYQEVENCCQALTDRLEGREYFFGNNGSELDALVYAHIMSILTTPVPADNNALGFLVEKFTKLVEHCKRIDVLVMGRSIDLTVVAYRKNKIGSVKFNEQVYFDTYEVGSIKNEQFNNQDSEVLEDNISNDEFYIVEFQNEIIIET